MSDVSFPTLPQNEKDLRRIVSVIRSAVEGKLNCVSTFTLSTGATSTVVSDRRVSTGSLIHLMPLTATANDALLAGTRVIDQNSSGFTVNHDSTSASDRRFRYGVIG